MEFRFLVYPNRTKCLPATQVTPKHLENSGRWNATWIEASVSYADWKGHHHGKDSE
jgi:hypothetical protein